MRLKSLCLSWLLALLLITPAWGQLTGSDKKPLPEKFDLREIGAVTPIKQQKGGTCWAHGSMAAIESNLLISGVWKKLGEPGHPALSEYHLDWWNGFNKHQNLDLADATKDPSGLKVHVGGDYRVTAAYLSRGDGVVAVPVSKEAPSPDWYPKAPERLEMTYKRYYVRNIEWFTIGDNLERIDAIKRRLMTEGAMGTAYAVSKALLSKDFVHYQPKDSKTKPNHAVAIVGWDDAKITVEDAKKAPKPGAWRIKNSWGTKRGDQGYYWISYYDKCCCRDVEMGAVSFRNIEPLRYSHVYHHDYHGWRDTMKEVKTACNAFTAVARHELRAVSFYTAADNVQYTVRLYSSFAGGQLTGAKTEKKGQIDRTGFHTIDLDAPVTIQKDEKFYVYLELSDGGQPIDRTSEIPVLLEQQKRPAGWGPNGPMVISKAGPGESYYHDGTAWRDLHEHRFTNPDWATFDRSANFCMKALAGAMPTVNGK